MDHDEQHDMSSEASGLTVVDLKGGLLPDLCKRERISSARDEGFSGKSTTHGIARH